MRLQSFDYLLPLEDPRSVYSLRMLPYLGMRSAQQIKQQFETVQLLLREECASLFEVQMELVINC